MHGLFRFDHILFVIGIILAVLNLVSFLASTYSWYVDKKHSSFLFIPFIGPILLDISLKLGGASGWILVLPWILDIGTMYLLICIPHLIGSFRGK
jgi:hypothetical protein